MKTYKNIIVATDFSENSLNAFHYAQHIAQHFDATLTVVHVFKIPLPTITPDYPDYFTGIPAIADLEKSALERLSEFVNEDNKGDEGNTMVMNRVRIKTEAVMGIPADKLIEYSQNPSTDLLILGTGAEHDWVDKVFGSFAIKVMKEAHCPVLLVPIAADYKGIYHLLYTASPHSSSHKEVSNAIDFAHHFNSALHFVHVNELSDTPNPETKQKFQQILNNKTTNLPYTIEEVFALTVAEGINAYCLENPIDLVVTVTHHRRFWDDLTHYSVAKALAWQAQLPILCFHKDEDE